MGPVRTVLDPREVHDHSRAGINTVNGDYAYYEIHGNYEAVFFAALRTVANNKLVTLRLFKR